eukprot:CCRYP_000353-RD/>CCRYP_000353-RD protein AED:0.34 eAED:0.30 QI:0/0/0/1/0/0/2/0/454
MDISNFYLNTPLKRPEFIRLNIRDIPQEIIDEYKLKDIAERDGSIYLQANKGMYGLPHGGLIANVLLEKRLNKAGYFQSKLVPGLWSHKTRPISFTLVVDDFGVKYIGKEHALHLQSVIEQHYKIDWDYINRKVHLSMPGYKDKALKQFQHQKATTQHSPFQCKPIKYGAKKQFAVQPSTAAPLDKADKKFIQQVCGKFLYLARAVDPTLLCPISAIASQSANPTTDTMEQTKQLLDYIATQDDAVITYSASDMVLAVHSDASYLSEPKARSRAAGHFFLSTAAAASPNNGANLNIAHIIKHVMASATEAELAALYIVAREAVYIRINPRGTRTQATSYPTANGQLHGRSCLQWENPTQKNQGNGHTFPLAQRSRMPRTIPHLLAAWKIELCRLLDETSSSQASPKGPPGFSHSYFSFRNATIPTAKSTFRHPSSSSMSTVFELLQGCDDPAYT